MLRLIKEERFFLPLLGFVAFLLRLIYIYQSRANPFFDAPVVDAQTFLEQALKMASGDWWPGSDPFWQPPLYPFFLALSCFFFPAHYFIAIRLLQSLLGTGSCLLIYLIAKRCTDPSTARIAATLAAIYGVFIYFEGELLAVSVEIFLDLLLLHRAIIALQYQRNRSWIGIGILGGLAGITRPNILLFLAFFLLWLLLLEHREHPHRWALPLIRKWLLIVIPLLLIILPVTLRNYAVSGELVFISSNGGINFYIGNNAAYDSTMAIHPGIHWEAMVEEPSHAGFTSSSARSAFFTAKALDYILSHPFDYALLQTKKLYLFWSGPEIKRNQNLYYARMHSTLLSFLLWDRVIAFPFGLIGSLSLVGLALNWRCRQRSVSLIRLYVLSYMVSILLFFVTARYRLPVLPILLIFASSTLCHLFHNLSTRQFKRLAILGLPLIALLIGLNLPSAPSLELDAQLYFDLGEVHLRKNDYDQAIENSLHALALEPDYNSARHNLTVAYFYQQRYEDAVRDGLRVVEENPLRPDTHIVLGRVYMDTERWEQASRHFQRALQIDRDSGMAHYYYGLLFYKQESYPEAIKHMLVARNWHPDDYWICYELARAYQRDGQLYQALHYFEKALQIKKHPAAANAIGAIYLLLGDLDQAGLYLAQALALAPDNLEARINTGLLYLQRGQPYKAIAHLRPLLEVSAPAVAAYRGLIEAYEMVGEHRKAENLKQKLDVLLK